jgi:hypothetical protein
MPHTLIIILMFVLVLTYRDDGTTTSPPLERMLVKSSPERMLVLPQKVEQIAATVQND